MFTKIWDSYLNLQRFTSHWTKRFHVLRRVEHEGLKAEGVHQGELWWRKSS